MDNFNQTSCNEISSKICSLVGQFSYEVSMIIVATLATAYVGGAGGAAKITDLIGKLGLKTPKLEEFLTKIVESIFKILPDSTKTKTGILSAELSEETHSLKVLTEIQFKKLGKTKEEIQGMIQGLSLAEKNKVIASLEKVSQGQALLLNESLDLAKLLNENKLNDILKFHATPKGSISAILDSSIDGTNTPHLKPNGKPGIYGSNYPANHMNTAVGFWKTGVGRAVNGEETILFQGDAAQLFKPHPLDSFSGVVKNLQDIQKTDMGRLVIDSYVREKDVLVVTKAHLVPLTSEQLLAAQKFIREQNILTGLGIIIYGSGTGAVIYYYVTNKNN